MSDSSKEAAAAATTPDANKDAATPDVELDDKKKQKKKEAELKKKEKEEKFLAKQKKLNELKEKEKQKEASGAKREKAKKEEIIPVDNTPKGQKKDLSGEMPSAYYPKYVESSWYSWWEQEGFFKPERSRDGKLDVNNPKGVYMIPIPPPNVTGNLHLGHALTSAVQDTLIRWNRMLGKTTLFNPGCDHAGIATQAVVEKQLLKDNLTRHDLGREKFVERVWEWKELYGHQIYEQLKRMGGSYDWDRAVFTMDPKLSRAVVESFIRLYNSGYIYRSTRLVNWCSKLRTAISNLEVDNLELTGPTKLSVPGHNPKKTYEFGTLTFFAYKLENNEGEIIVATTRVETMLGDTAIAVNPKDERYKNWIGKNAVHPFVDRLLPIVGDDMVDMEFGSGAVKITPAHDHNDYQVGQRHNLPIINILDDDGNINHNGGKFKGRKRFDAREAILEELKQAGLYKETKPNPMKIPVCSRSGDIIEPYIKPQWYVRVEEMNKKSVDAVKTGELEILPKVFEKNWFQWLENPQDWCISRQLWWGHRIPAYFIKIEGLDIPMDEADEKYWVAAASEEDALKLAKEKFPDVPSEKIQVFQDEDVLDTWYSSGLFPFSIFGWPDNTPELEMFYPNSLLETGWDILTFWVSRMVMLGITLTGKVPFKQVYLHAMVRDSHGRKMSKSKGNVIDPLDVIEGISLEGLQKRLDENPNISKQEREVAKKGQKQDFPNGIGECGTDALRFALCAYMVQARDINLDVKRVEGYRHFCNKIWQACRFSMKYIGDMKQPSDYTAVRGSTLLERWILNRLHEAIVSCNQGFQQYNFPAVTTAIYNFWLYELCDVFLEGIKPTLFNADMESPAAVSIRNVLYICLDVGLRLLSPFMPFITEELFQRLPNRVDAGKCSSICIAPYPEEDISKQWSDKDAENTFTRLYNCVKSIRSLTAAVIKTGNKPTVFVYAKENDLKELISNEVPMIQHFIKPCAIELSTSEPGENDIKEIADAYDVYYHQ